MHMLIIHWPWRLTVLSAGIKNNLLIDVTLVFMRDGHVEVEKYPLNGWKSIFESLTRQKIVYRNPLMKVKKSMLKLLLRRPTLSSQLTVKFCTQNLYDIWNFWTI